MKIFNFDKVFSVVCNFVSTRNGFKHTATLCKNGISIYSTKVCYLNRTWERFEYETILEKVIGENFTGTEKEKYLEVIK